MESLLKTATVNVDGQEIEITELNALAHTEVMDSQAKGVPVAEMCALSCKHCVPAWRDATVAAIMQAATLTQLQRISDAIMELSGFDDDDLEADVKNSEADRAANFS